MAPLGKLLVAVSLALQASAKTIRINVGESGLAFSPSSVTAAKGDVLEYHFFPINHSVVAGDFSNPCAPSSSGGFFSGFMPTKSGENANVFSVTVNDTNPIVFYCAQNTLSHCKSGMSGIVNANSSDQLQTYQNAAKNVQTAISPASVFGGTVGAASASSSSTSSSASSTATSGSGYGGGSSGGSGAGGQEASVIAVLGAFGLALFMA
ncbi:hypothetical protein NKR23_g8469 [Pleurostoma richardsiae]|uniref:Extracellular serine-rich protein n=1 Tax=Pleurostoma richardsiae TaxID=41990 RepID=A0AA38RIJ4_9PEZI|nr:hypothetical protein NKR23_g8469 [Pleurostoma richardsiae]